MINLLIEFNHNAYYMYYNSEEDNYYNEQVNIINNYLKDKIKIRIDLQDIKLNDNIYIDFIPDSQKYITTLFPKYGKIINIEDNNIEIFNLSNITESLLHDSVSYFGDSLGYSYVIYKILNI